MSEAQPIVPLLVMWQRALRIRQCMNQEQHASGLVYEVFDMQDMIASPPHYPTTEEQALFLFCEQEQPCAEKLEGSSVRLWWEEFAQETDWAQWKDDDEWTDWNKCL